LPQTAAEPFLPVGREALERLQEEVSYEMPGLSRVGAALAFVFGEAAAHRALRALLIESAGEVDPDPTRRELFDRIGWREFLKTEAWGDPLELTYPWYEAAAYAGQGIAPQEPATGDASLADREARVRNLISRAEIAGTYSSLIVGSGFDFIWTGVTGRAAVDFGHPISIDGLQLLSGLSLAGLRNAISTGDLHPDAAGNVACDEARAWLAGRRNFCPSRWRNLEDNQQPFDPAKVVEPDAQGMIWVPQADEGEAFVPDLVVRRSRRSPGLSITIGAKGEEEQFHDFYEALEELAKRDVARWRRRNAAGNWGIVRARGAWITVSKAEIDRQLAAKQTEAC